MGWGESHGHEEDRSAPGGTNWEDNAARRAKDDIHREAVSNLEMALEQAETDRASALKTLDRIETVAKAALAQEAGLPTEEASVLCADALRAITKLVS